MDNIDHIKFLLEYLTKRAITFEQFGVYIAIDDKGNLFSCPMEKCGTPEYDEDYPHCFAFMEVTAPESDFLEVVNKQLGTSYSMTEFSGR